MSDVLRRRRGAGAGQTKGVNLGSDPGGLSPRLGLWVFLAAAALQPQHARANDAAAAAAAAQSQANALLARLEPAARPFQFVVKDARELKGLFTLWQQDEKIWIALRPEQLEQPFFLSYNVSHSVGERRLYAGQMGGSRIALWRRVGNQVQLIAKNTAYRAAPGTPQALAVSQAFSDSLLASAPVASAAHPASKAFLVEANALLLTDIPGYATQLESAYRLPYQLDARNSSFASARGDAGLTGLQVNAHFALARLPAPAPGQPGAPAPAMPDPRSLFAGFYYSFAALPASVMPGRAADDRIGHFATTVHDYSDDLSAGTALRHVYRWRLEPADAADAANAADTGGPGAPREPKQPIVYWIDKNVPLKYRRAVAEGVLEWNRAFEKIGFKNAIVVRQQSEQDAFDTLDARHASIRWFLGSDVGFAAGPVQVDPRSGEILDADIAMSDVYARSARRFAADHPEPGSAGGAGAAAAGAALCEYGHGGHGGGADIHFALDLLAARGGVEADLAGPQAEALAQAYVRQVIMHEVGHTLGLRHNFRASTIYSLRQLQDPRFGKQRPLAGSVMDYLPFNLAAPGQAQGPYVNETLGPYDYWAIEYAYKTLPAADEKQLLAEIAARSSEPALAYGTDEDAQANVADPEVNAFDLGDDPLLYARQRLGLTRELWQRLETRRLPDGESYATLRRGLNEGFSQLAATLPVALKYIGGVRMLRDHAGTARAPFTPVALHSQRAALALITDSVFAADSLRFSPALISRLGIDHFEQQPDIAVGRRVLALQSNALDQVLADAVAARLLDAQAAEAGGAPTLSLGELYASVQGAVWSELKQGKNIPAQRRNLQREHLKRLAGALLRPGPGAPADVRSLQRQNAIALRALLRAGLPGKSLDRETRAHLSECAQTLDEALRAPLLRATI
ncbi:zinc-dependent metalloprotease [Janthinobacterium sp. CG3]|uniref:zinc-dependent metalloprotease n=1 Tax=Janthinobacterium sp. CG3 TaxID=1075768 RepID=UPI00036410A0|nr:zinc-dependent metalloprotease [Janthinobacterium sp. CG3]